MPATARLTSLSFLSVAWFVAAGLVGARSIFDPPDPSEPCVDFSGIPVEAGNEPWDEVEVVPGLPSRSGFTADKDCDPEAELFLRSEPPQEKLPESRSHSFLSFTVGQLPGQPARSIVRNRAASNGWEHRFEFRDDSLTRRRIGWHSGGWRLIAGDLTDRTFPMWPLALPRRTLPGGWKAARAAVTDTHLWSDAIASALPQGIAGGVSDGVWSAYALHSWNPVETHAEPPWRAPWMLRHFAAGLSAAPRGWLFASSLHLSETRIARGRSDTLSERLLAAGISTGSTTTASAARAKQSATFTLLAARMESDQVANKSRAGHLVDARIARRFRNASNLEFTVRQRDAGWRSAWDPTIPADAVYGGGDDRAGSGWNLRGAGESRLAGSWPLEWNPFEASESAVESRGKLRGEFLRAWNPAARTSRQGARGTFEWNTGSEGEGVRFIATATHRTTHNASGNTTLYRYLEAEARQQEFPRWNLAAWRAWNGDGPLRTGFQWGVEPVRGRWHATAALRMEADETDGSDRLGGTLLLGLRGRFGTRWKLDASGAIPCARHGIAEGLRWRMTLETTR
jgi:hypothetical protein